MSKHRTLLAGLRICVLLCAIAGCKGSKTPAAPPAPANPTASNSPREAATPEFVKAANDLEAAVMAADVDAINKVIDSDALLEASTSGVGASKEFHDGFIRGVKSNGIGQMLAGMRKASGTYRVLRVFTQDGKTRAIYRLLQAGGLNYHDWILTKGADGKVRAVDAYIALTGEYLSQTFRRLYVKAAAGADTGLLSRLVGTDREFYDHAADLDRMSTDLKAENYQAVLDTYAKLPASLQKEKSFFLYRIMASEKLNDAHPGEYVKAIEDYEKAFPGDPSLDIISLDGTFLSKNYAGYYTAVDHLEKWTGGDPYLQSLRGNVLLVEDKPGAAAGAEKLARAAIETESRLLMPRVVLVKSLSAQGKYKEAVEQLKLYEEASGGPIEADALSEMKGLGDSPEYKAYRKSAGL